MRTSIPLGENSLSVNAPYPPHALSRAPPCPPLAPQACTPRLPGAELGDLYCRPYMSRVLLTLLLFVVLGPSTVAKVLHPVPKDRESLSTGDWFPHVLAKLAPLEEWNVILSSEDLIRDRYNSDFAFQ